MFARLSLPSKKGQADARLHSETSTAGDPGLLRSHPAHLLPRVRHARRSDPRPVRRQDAESGSRHAAARAVPPERPVHRAVLVLHHRRVPRRPGHHLLRSAGFCSARRHASGDGAPRGDGDRHRVRAGDHHRHHLSAAQGQALRQHLARRRAGRDRDPDLRRRVPRTVLPRDPARMVQAHCRRRQRLGRSLAAGDRARLQPLRRQHASDAQLRHRDPQPGLGAHGVQQGPLAQPRAARARAAQFADPR